MRNENNVMGNKLKRAQIGLGIATISTLCMFLALGVFGDNQLGEILMITGLVAMVASYIVGGGFGKAISSAFKFAKFGWLILPFPYDIMTGFITLFLAIILFPFVPVVFMFMSY